MLGPSPKCSTKDDCPDNVCYDQKYCVAVDPASGKGVCYYGRCKPNDVCEQAYFQCATQFVPTPSVPTRRPLDPTPNAPALLPSVLPTTIPVAPIAEVSTPDESSKGMSTGAIVGIAVGALVFLALVIGGIWWWRNKDKSKNEDIIISGESEASAYKSPMQRNRSPEFQGPKGAIPTPFRQAGVVLIDSRVM